MTYYAIVVIAGLAGTTLEASGPYLNLSSCMRAVAQGSYPVGVKGVGCVTQDSLSQMRMMIR
jgi:hypothetical protein